jgi:hypothetical protein
MQDQPTLIRTPGDWHGDDNGSPPESREPFKIA